MNVKNAYQRMVICSMRTRPIRSASAPATQPPSDDTTYVTVPISPAWVLEMPQAAISVGMT